MISSDTSAEKNLNQTAHKKMLTIAGNNEAYLIWKIS